MRRLTFLTVSLALIAAACSVSGDGEPTTTTSEPSDVTTTTAGAASTTTTEAEPTTTTTVASSAGSSCVEGTWVLDTESFVASMEALFSEEGFAADSISPNEGDYVVTFGADGTFTTERTEWGFTLETSEGTFRLTISGSETGTWAADDETITVTVTESDVTASSQAEVDGQVIELPEAPVDVPDAVAEDSAYVCSGNVLTVTTDDVEITLNRA